MSEELAAMAFEAFVFCFVLLATPALGVMIMAAIELALETKVRRR